jgi:hypothetical protein
MMTRLRVVDENWPMTTLLAASAAEVTVAIVVATALGLLWIVALIVLVSDTISVGAKILWFVLLTLLAPIAIPVYLLLWYRRRSRPAQA